jgi:hypothetical protein
MGCLVVANDYSKEIARLEQLINSGAQSVSADGVSSSFDLDSARKRLAELRRLQGDGQELVKRKVSTLNLGGCW